jgi:hypothetical protein
VTNNIDVRKPSVIAVIADRCYTTELTEKERLRVTIPETTAADATTGNDATQSTNETNDATTSTSGIARQRERAIQYWNDSKAKHGEVMKDHLHDDVITQLRQGKVLPIFHTLCRSPSERLFLPNTRVSVDDETSDMIQLSTEPVSMGEAVKDVENEISLEDEMSYIPAFFNENGTGHFYVKDLAFRWNFTKKYTQIVTDLVNAPADMVGEDIEVTKLVEPFAVDQKSGHNLITRRLSRGVVADCFAKSELCSTYAIVGNPGIGKSWTLICALQQALLYDNVCVLLCFQKDSMAIVCIRRNNQIFVWMCKHPSFGMNLDSLLFQNSNVLVLLDPRESAKGGAAYVEGRRMLIMAASNNEMHFKSIGKFTGDYPRILSCYTDAELKIALQYMNTDPLVTLEQMLERASIIGNLPRYILSDVLFIRRQKETAAAISGLKNFDVKEIDSVDGITRTGSTVPGCIFAVNLPVDVNSSDEDDKIGYDGQFIQDYEQRKITMISEHVRAKIVQSNRKRKVR